MGINFKNFLSSQKNNTKMGDYQNLDHLDGRFESGTEVSDPHL